MAATSDIRFKRMQGQHRTLQDAQDELFDKVDSFEAALLGLTEAVSRNTEDIAEVNRKLDAIIKHLKVPYKPPAGFVKE